MQLLKTTNEHYILKKRCFLFYLLKHIETHLLCLDFFFFSVPQPTILKHTGNLQFDLIEVV